MKPTSALAIGLAAFLLVASALDAHAEIVRVTLSGTLTADGADSAGVDGADFVLIWRHDGPATWLFDAVGSELYTSSPTTRRLTLTNTPGGFNDGVFFAEGDYRFGTFGLGPRVGQLIGGNSWIVSEDAFDLNGGLGLLVTPILGNGSVVASAGADVIPENFGGDNGTDVRVGLDRYTVNNLSVLATQVPEPSSLALLALGGLALFVRRRVG